MRLLAGIAIAALVLALAGVQLLSSIALRGSAERGAWVQFVPPRVAGWVDRLPPGAPLPPALGLVLARNALAAGDLTLAERDIARLSPSRDRSALAGRLAEARGDSTAAVADYLAAGDLAGLERRIAELVGAGRIPAALDLQRAAIAKLQGDRTQADALAHAYFALGRLEETAAYALAVGSPERHARELDSRDAYRNAVALAPLDESNVLAYANQLLNVGELDAAKRTFGRARDLDPASAEPLAGLGEIALRQGRPARARAYLLRARAIDPSSNAVRRLAHELGAAR
jgi:tetratricopeptide (TPR) repeat protein